MDKEKQDDTSIEYMRMKLWCDAVIKMIGSSNQVLELADAALKTFDERFGKRDGK